jgi:hypothetical protein
MRLILDIIYFYKYTAAVVQQDKIMRHLPYIVALNRLYFLRITSISAYLEAARWCISRSAAYSSGL